jgi:hypothetical protein
MPSNVEPRKEESDNDLLSLVSEKVVLRGCGKLGIPPNTGGGLASI